MIRKAKDLFAAIQCFFREPRKSFSLLRSFPFILRGIDYGARKDTGLGKGYLETNNKETYAVQSNPLKLYFDSIKEGRGIWKWEHYFDIYHKYFNKFIGKKVNILEVGIYSGGSLNMWKNYFGKGCHVYGVDIENACKVYEQENVSIFIGDQQDPSFWKRFRDKVPIIDIIIDDGGHKTEQQIVTLQEMLSHLQPGGVYLCEDIHGDKNYFNSFISGLTSQLNYAASIPALFQSSIDSIHFYPFIIVIEKRNETLNNLIAPKHGTEWQPFRM